VNTYHIRIVEDERRYPEENPDQFQPFLVNGSDGLSLSLLERGEWSQVVNRESTAWAISQITAAQILPPLVEVPTGAELLNYRVHLRDQIDPILVRELRLILESNWQDLGWEQLSGSTFLCVIGAGVAACIDLTSGEEQLYLRYASSLANDLFHAGRALDLPRSRLFLQTALYEKVNLLLAGLRDRSWQWV
jgi:hypothetical protein